MSTLITVVTPPTGAPLLETALESVAQQTYRHVQHLIVIDGAERSAAARKIIANRPIDLIELPYATGIDRYNGHRIYGAATFPARGEAMCFLDEDNWMDKDHLESLVRVLERGNEWAFSLRKITDQHGKFVCHDNCEPLGKWPTVISPTDYLVDVNCFLLPKTLAVNLAPLWYRRARERGVVEVDRMLTQLHDQLPRGQHCEFGKAELLPSR